MRRALLSASLVGLLLTGCGVSPSLVSPVPPAMVAQQAAPQVVVYELTESLRYTTLDLLGITSSEAQALKALQIRTAGDLLYAASKRIERTKISTMTGIPASKLLRWVNHVDLMRVTGVGPQFSYLLEASGVDTVPELARRLPINLCKALKVANKSGLVKRLPSQTEVDGWVARAKKANRVVEY